MCNLSYEKLLQRSRLAKFLVVAEHRMFAEFNEYVKTSIFIFRIICNYIAHVPTSL